MAALQGYALVCDGVRFNCVHTSAKGAKQVLVQTEGGKGAAVTLRVPATATLADGSSVTINTSYPFSDSVLVSCKPKAAGFPLLIRVPSWATKATLNGHYREHHNAGKSYSTRHASALVRKYLDITALLID